MDLLMMGNALQEGSLLHEKDRISTPRISFRRISTLHISFKILGRISFKILGSFKAGPVAGYLGIKYLCFVWHLIIHSFNNSLLTMLSPCIFFSGYARLVR